MVGLLTILLLSGWAFDRGDFDLRAFDLDPHLSVTSIGFVYVFVCRKLSPHLRV